MKNQKLSIVATITIIVSLSIVGIAGLVGRVQADIPFDFMVGGKEFKAGEYSVERLRLNNSNGALIIRSADNDEAANFIVTNVTDKTSQGPRLVFRRYGNHYFLTQIFDGLSNQGAELTKSKAEREAAKKRDIITQTVIEPETMTVVAKLGQ